MRKKLFSKTFFLIIQIFCCEILVAESILPSEYGPILFITSEGKSSETLGVMSSTDSNYFLFEDGSVFVTNVNDPKKNLKEVVIKNGLYTEKSMDAALQKDLKWTLAHVRSVISKNESALALIEVEEAASGRQRLWHEDFYGCKNVDFYVNFREEKSSQALDKYPYNAELVIPGRGIIYFQDSPANIESLVCRDDGAIVVGAIGCESSGRCKQVVNIIDSVKRSVSSDVKSDEIPQGFDGARNACNSESATSSADMKKIDFMVDSYKKKDGSEMVVDDNAVPICLVGRELAYLLDVSYPEKPINFMLGTLLIRPKLGETKDIGRGDGEHPPLRNPAAHDFDNDGVSEVVTKDYSVMGGYSVTREAILQIDGWVPRVLRSVSSESNAGAVGDDSEDYRENYFIWQLEDVDGDKVEDLVETEIANNGKDLKAPISLVKRSIFYYKNGKFVSP